MLPQEGPDQLENAIMIENLGAGLQVDQSERESNPSGFQSEIKNKIEN